MNDQYERVLTPKVAQELIQVLFSGQSVQRQQIIEKVDKAHRERGGYPPTVTSHHPVDRALSKMKRLGLANNISRGIWSIFPVEPSESENSTESKECSEIKTLNKFVEWVHRLPQGEYVYRGVSNKNYSIEASTYRRLKNENGEFRNEEDKSAERLLQINSEMIEEANRHRHGWKNEQPLSDLNLLAELQHYGAATCLIDFTKNPLVALWMACRKSSGGLVDGKVYAVEISSQSPFKSVNSTQALNEEISHFFQPNVRTGYQLYQWQPNYQNNRMLAQQSIFLFGGGADAIKASAECVILQRSKKEIGNSLKKSAGITEDILFPDFEGFASQRAENKKYNVPYVPIDVDREIGASPEEGTNGTEEESDKDDYMARHYLELGRQAAQSGHSEQAVRWYNNGIMLRPSNLLLSNLYRERAAVYHYTYNFEAAINDYSEAIRLDSTSGSSYYWRGRVNYDHLQYSEAIVDFDEAIRLNFNNESSYYWHGMANYGLGQYSEAVVDFNQTISINSNNEHSYYWRGVAKCEMKKYSEAITDFNQTISRNPNHVHSYHWRGIAEYNIGRHKAAIVDLSRAISYNISDAYLKGNSYYWRGMVKKKLRLFDEAKRDFQEALVFARDSEDHDLIDLIFTESVHFKEMGYDSPSE